MAQWSGKTRGGIAGYKAFAFILKNFGLSFTYFILRFVVVYFFLFAPRAVRSSFYLFNQRLQFSRFKSYQYVLKNFYKLGQNLIDKFAFISGTDTKFSFEFDGEHHLRKMAEENGGILIGAHAGNWEIAGYLLKRLDAKINIVIYFDEHEKIQNFLSNSFSKSEVSYIIINQDYSHLFQIENALKNGELVAMHGDRYLPGMNTQEVEFLGKAAKFPTGPFSLAYKFKMPVTYVTAMKQTSRHYYFYASKPVISEYPNILSERKKIISNLVEDYVSQVEKIIKRFPEQWFNFYNFWEDQH